MTIESFFFLFFTFFWILTQCLNMPLYIHIHNYINFMIFCSWFSEKSYKLNHINFHFDIFAYDCWKYSHSFIYFYISAYFLFFWAKFSGVLSFEGLGLSFWILLMICFSLSWQPLFIVYIQKYLNIFNMFLN